MDQRLALAEVEEEVLENQLHLVQAPLDRAMQVVLLMALAIVVAVVAQVRREALPDLALLVLAALEYFHQFLAHQDIMQVAVAELEVVTAVLV
jgi:hypothetical protein